MENDTLKLISLVILLALGVILIPIQQVQSEPLTTSRINRTDECDQKELRKAAYEYASSIHIRFVPRNLKCEGGWAVWVGDIEDPNAPIDGPQGVATTLIFHREESLWKHQVSSLVCGTINSQKLEERPHDAKIPSSLYFIGCLVG